MSIGTAPSHRERSIECDKGERAVRVVGDGVKWSAHKPAASPLFIDKDVGFRAQEDLVAASTVRPDGEEIRHCASRHKDGGFLAEQLGNGAL